MATVETFSTADTWVDAFEPTSNKNSETSLVVGDRAGSDKGRAILRFTLPSDPGVGSVIDKIELQLFEKSENNGGTYNINVYGQDTSDSTSWVENQATWDIAATGNNWTAAGGASDFSTTIIDTVVRSGAAANAYIVWVLQGTGATNPLSSNWGDTINLFLRAPSSAPSNRIYASSATAGTSQDPKLTITYSAGGGAAQTARRGVVMMM